MNAEPDASYSDRVRAGAEHPMGRAQSVVAASLRRSLKHYGLDPDDACPSEILSDIQLHAAQATLDRLFQTVGDSGCCGAVH